MIMTKEILKEAKEIMRRQEIITGTITKHQIVPVPEHLKSEKDKMEVLEVDFGGGIVGTCTEDLFDTHKYRSLSGFVFYDQPFVIERIDEKNSLIIVNRIKAREILKNHFWSNIEEGMEIDATFVSWNRDTNNIIIDIFGQTCWMSNKNWDHSFVPGSMEDINKKPGDSLQVKILRFDKEKEVVEVSRKDLFPDPWVNAGERYTRGTIVAGEVINVVIKSLDSRNDMYFVQLEDSGITILCRLKDGEPRPRIHDRVSVRIDVVNEDRRRGRGLIIKYINRREYFSNAAKLFNPRRSR